MPRFQRTNAPDERDDKEIDLGDDWRPRPRRLLIGVALIAVALVWSFLNGTVGGYKKSSIPVVHGPVPTYVQTVVGMRVRPELPRTVTAVTPPARVDISFHNDGSQPRAVSPHNLRLVLGRQTLYPLASPRTGLRTTVVLPNRYVTGVLYFARPLAPGAVLVFDPPWGAGQRLQWPLWR